jgi:transposase
MSLTWYGSQSKVEGRCFGPLALIVPLLERMNVMEIIDRFVAPDQQAEFSHGKVLSLLIAGRVFSPMALINVATWAAESGADILWDMPVEKINDDRLGRSLDAFFTQRHSILAEIALHVAREFDVSLRDVHYDPTHILFRGAYADAVEREPVNGEIASGKKITRSDDTLGPAHITTGRATDDAPHGSQMIHAGLCTHVDEFGPLPFFGHTVDGNQNGRTAVSEQFALWQKHLPFTKLTMISDRGTFSVGHLLRLADAGGNAICSAPWDEFQPLFDQHRKSLTWKKASYLSIEQQRRRTAESDLPQEHYELAVLRHELKDADSGRTISCRAIFVFSTADQKVVRKQRKKQIDKLRQGLEQIQKSVAAGRRGTDLDAVTRRVGKLFGTKEAARYFHWELESLTAAQRKRLPKPGRGCKLPKHRFSFSFDGTAVKDDEQYDGYSVVVTTVPKGDASADELFTKFKQQSYSEQVNSEFKGPLAIRPVFLHSPQRVEALVFLMMIALTLYYLLQRMYRQSVPAKASPKERRTTTQTILRAFTNYTLLIHHTELGIEVQTTRLTTRQREILQRLGFATPAQILRQRLPRPPPR